MDSADERDLDGLLDVGKAERGEGPGRLLDEQVLDEHEALLGDGGGDERLLVGIQPGGCGIEEEG